MAGHTRKAALRGGGKGNNRRRRCGHRTGNGLEALRGEMCYSAPKIKPAAPCPALAPGSLNVIN
jgi:hypothetical protein